MTIFLNGLRLSNYRGIGPEEQCMAPFSQFNFFIGANNAGKSGVINFIANYLNIPTNRRSSYNPEPIAELDPLERHGAHGDAPEMALGLPAAPIQKRLSKKVSQFNPRVYDPLLGKLFASITDKSLIWLKSRLPYSDPLTLDYRSMPEDPRSVMGDREWGNLWSALHPGNSGGSLQHWVPACLEAVRAEAVFHLPKVRLVPAYRQIGPRGSDFADFSGAGLIDRLAQVQNPTLDRRDEKSIFERINVFLRTVTDKFDAQIEIPHDRSHILVHMDNRVLPLISLGTGIHEVVMIAAFCTLSEDQIVCIEEPEIHLHPILQRKLVRYLASNTTNQYFIATHSASFIDTPGAAIFHVTHDGKQTFISESTLRRDLVRICTDLGHRASDIVQSNAIVWVEGPSDRIYLRHWIAAIDPDLIENIHYSIMFYGGRLLSHLSANDEDISEFIDLRSLNQNIAVVMDSDKVSVDDAVNATKLRVLDEFAGSKGCAWITQGREIENYVPHDLLQKCVGIVVGQAYGGPSDGGVYSHALYFKRALPRTTGTGREVLGVEKSVDKVKVAREVCKSPARLDVLDLRERVTDLVAMIHAANH